MTPMKVLCVDNEPRQLNQITTSVTQMGHRVIGFNGAKAMAINSDEALSFDAAVVDQNLENDITGEEVGRLLRSMNPGIFLIMLTAHSQLERAVEAMKGGKFDDYIAKGTSQAPELLRKALTNANMHAQLCASQQVAHGDSPLFDHIRHLVGIDRTLCEISEALEAFFLWRDNKLDLYPEDTRPDFISGILLKGEPGSGKSDICQAVASAFGYTNFDSVLLPKHLGPTERRGEWRTLLREHVWPFYERALDTSKVVVIVADDLAWQAPGKMQAGEWAAEFQNYMHAIRDCMIDANFINGGKSPSRYWKDRRTPQGKIFWLLAKNLEDDVGESFRALESFIISFEVKFPRDDLSRGQALQAYAIRNKAKFSADAITLALQNLRSPAYLGRELLAEDKSGQGFARWCLRRVNKMCRQAQDSGTTIPKIITPAIVQEWLNSEQHRTIMGTPISTGPSSSQPSSMPNPAEAGGHASSTAPDHLSPSTAARIARANARLNEWNLAIGEIWDERTRDLVSKEEKERVKVTTDELGRKLKKPCSGANVRQIFARHEAEMLELVSKAPGNFANLCRLDHYKGWFGKWLEIHASQRK